jgi:hypothetical protein
VRGSFQALFCERLGVKFPLSTRLQDHWQPAKKSRMNKEKWNEIYFYLSENIGPNISESEFEQNVIQALRVWDGKNF